MPPPVAVTDEAQTEEKNEQPEEFAFETLIADYADYFTKNLNGAFQKVISVEPVYATDPKHQFKKSLFLSKIDLRTKYDLKKNLDRLTQLQLGAITPVVSLFRRDYIDGKDDLAPGAYKDRLFLFNNVYPENIKSASNSRNSFLESQFKGEHSSNPTLMSSALINVDYTFAGRNPVESERAIDVTISMKFASFEALLGSNAPTVSDNWGDILVNINKNNPSKFPLDRTDYTDEKGTNNSIGVTKNFLSLITHPPSGEQIKEFSAASARIYYPNKFRVYLKLGWRLPDASPSLNEIFPSPDFDGFVSSLNSGEHDKEMLLNLVNHELTFNEEGGIELKVNYIGSLDTNLTSNDSDFIYALYKKELEKIKNNTAVNDVSGSTKAVELINKWANSNCGTIKSDDPIDKKRKELEDKLSTSKEESQDALQNALNNVYSNFLTYLVDKGATKNIKLISIKGNLGGEYSKTMQSDERTLPIIQKIFSDSSGLTTQDGVSAARSDAQTLARGVNEGKEGLEASEFYEFDSPLENIEQLKENTVKADPWNLGFDSAADQRFKIIRVGDLLDGLLLMLEELNGSSFMKSFFIVLDEFYYYPRTKAKTAIRLPIANIPINFDSFLIWFKDNIVAKQRKNYVLKDFLTDFFTTLVIPTLKGHGTSEKIGRQYNVFFEQKFISSRPIEGSDDNGSTCSIVPRIKAPFAVSSRQTINNTILKNINTGTKKPQDFNILFITMKVADADGRGRIYDNLSIDRDENISHFWVGDTKGMIKSIKFKRVEQPGLKEAKATKDAFIPLNQLRDLYNTDITMFGNHYYYPGDLIFIHPQNSILGEPYQKGSIANIMGIGGYYDVIKVSSNIGEGGYETNLECIWTCSGEEFNSSELENQVKCKEIKDEYKKVSGEAFPEKA